MRQAFTYYTFIIVLLLPAFVFSQTNDTIPIVKYAEPKDYEIGGIKVTGANYSDDNAIIAIAGLKIGDKIRVPGEDIFRVIKALWKLRLFTDIQIYQEKLIGDVIFLELVVQERPRLSQHSFKGVKKSQHDDLNEEVNKYLLKGGIVTENVKTSAINAIKGYYKGSGYLDVRVTATEFPDEKIINSVRIEFDIDKKDKVKIQDIVFVGNDNVKRTKLLKKMENTHKKTKLFSKSKLVREDFDADLASIIAYYNTIGYRDARIISDTAWREEDGHLRLHINIFEGNRYYFRNINWKGNSIYASETLSQVLGIGSGEVYNQELLDTRLSFSMDGRDVSTLYMDNGYLFFQVDPIETSIVEDSIDLEIRIFEGPQATIDRVVIKGNDRTHEHVIRRELRTQPGQKFSRTDIIRSQREIINLGYFNPEALQINTPVNPQRGTVDIEYTVEEKPSDQLELSAGWAGQGRGVIGTLGVSFNNFSLRNIFNKESWSPLPQGDGQKLSLRAQTNGKYYQSYNISFTEPWMGGKKPNSFTLAGFYSKFAYGEKDFSNYQKFEIYGGSVTLGTRLKFPDDNFISQTTLSLQTYSLQNWSQGLFISDEGVLVTDGDYYNFAVKETITRSTISDPLFPTNGSRFSLSVQVTPPYSLFNDKNYEDLPVTEKYKWLEYNKWRFTAEWYTQVVGKLVLKVGAKIGMIGAYNQEIGIPPFERFQLGGDGFANQQFGGYTGIDLISLRGYDVEDIRANVYRGIIVATPLFNKFTVELRYPVSLNPSATIYVLTFMEGGNSYRTFRDYNPFEMYRVVGAGLRVFLPMFGTLGFDYGIGYDKVNTSGNIFQDYGRFSIILGFEPE